MQTSLTGDNQILSDLKKLGMPVRSVLIVLGFQLGGTLMELLGLAALVPIFQFLQSGGDVDNLVVNSDGWEILSKVHGFFAIDLSLWSLLGFTFLTLILRQVFTYARLVYQSRVKESLVASIRATIFDEFLSADLTFQEKNDVGGVVNDLTTELTRAVENVFSSISLIGYILIFSVYVFVFFVVSGPMTFLALAVFGVLVLLLRRLLAESERVGSQITAANQNMSSFLVERLRHARLIRLAGSEVFEVDRMRELTERQRDRNVRIFTLLASLEIIIEPLVIGGALVFVYVSIEFFSMPFEAIALFLLMLVRLLPVVKEATRVRQSRRGSRAAFEAVMTRIIETRAEQELDSGGLCFEGVNGSISFSRVTFTYPDCVKEAGRSVALDDVSFEVRRGEITAIVGPSGAGKSTLVDLIPRLRHPQSGSIEVDGCGLELFSLRSLRQGIAYAPQSPQIFNVSLADHIRYGRPSASLEEVRRAADLANASGFIEAMPEGYGYLAGENGSRLSGGQRQRIDLARALVSGAPILILDEPTSALDAESEALFRGALEHIRRETDITVIIIAHRLSTVSIADKIIVLQNGRVIGEGTHDQLISTGGWYRDAFLSQQGTQKSVRSTG